MTGKKYTKGGPGGPGFSYHNRADIAAVALLLAVAFITRYLFIYRNGMSEPDSMVMAAGMAWMSTPGAVFSDCLLYGRELNPGFYFIFKTIYPLFYDDPGHVIAFLNSVGVVCASLAVWPGYIILRNWFNTAVSTSVIILVIFSPIAWELGTYFHPVTPSILLFLCAWSCWRGISRSGRGIFCFIVTSVLASAAVMIRTEIVMIAPALLLSVLMGKERKKDTAALSAILVIAAAGYLALLGALPSRTGGAGTGISGFIDSFSDMYHDTLSISGLPRTIVWASLGVGTGTIFIIFAGIATALARRSFAGKRIEAGNFFPALLWIIPSLALWLLWPVPVIRHYYIIIPAAVWIAAKIFLAYLSPKKTFAVVAAALLLNIFLPEILYRAYNSAAPASMKEPHGTFFYYHERVMERIDRYGDMQTRLLAGTIGKTGAISPPGRFFIPASWESYGYLVYSMAATERLIKVSEGNIVEGVFVHSYMIDDSEVIVADARGFSLNTIPPALIPLVREKEGEGYTLLLPSEIAFLDLFSDLPRERIFTY